MGYLSSIFSSASPSSTILRASPSSVLMYCLIEVNDASIADGRATVNVGGSINTVGQLLESKVS
jgi:hypothetical protein